MSKKIIDWVVALKLKITVKRIAYITLKLNKYNTNNKHWRWWSAKTKKLNDEKFKLYQTLPEATEEDHLRISKLIDKQ